MMQLKLLIILIWNVLIIFAKEDQKNLQKSNWKEILIKNVIKNSKKYQIMLMMEKVEINKQWEIKNIFPNLKKEPILISTLPQGFNSTIKNPALNKNPRATTFFILLTTTIGSKMNETMKFLAYLSHAQMRPKCLIIHLVEKNNNIYKDFLENLWKNRFIDVTILQIIKKITKKNLQTNEKEIAIIHQFNPFNQIYSRQKLTDKINWFSQKTQNMYGYPFLITGHIFYDIKWDIPEDDIEFYGGSLALFKVLSEKMNFTQKIIRITREELGTEACSKNNFTGQMIDLVENKFQVVLNKQYMPLTCEEDYFLRSRIITMEPLVAVVPRIPISIVDGHFLWKVLYIFSGIIIALIFIRILTYILKFEKKYWRIIDLLSILLAMSASSEPRRIKEKIVFGCLILTSLIYSSYIHTLMTNNNLQGNAEMDIRNMRDIDKAGLIPIFDTFFRVSAGIGSKSFENLRLKSLVFIPGFNRHKCFASLAKYKNITCGLWISFAQELMKKYLFDFAKLDMKIVPEHLVPSPLGWMFEPGCPYVEKFNELLEKLVENGLLDKWRVRGNFDENTVTYNEEGIAKPLKLQNHLIFILIFGYSISFFVFVGEILVDYFGKHRITNIK